MTKTTSNLVPAGATQFVPGCPLWFHSPVLLSAFAVLPKNAVWFHYHKQGGIELLQQPKGVPGMAFSTAGNLARKGKKARRNCKSGLWTTILGSFTGKEGKIFISGSWYQEWYTSRRIWTVQKGLGSNRAPHSSDLLLLCVLAPCPPSKESHMFYCWECFIKPLWHLSPCLHAHTQKNFIIHQICDWGNILWGNNMT